MASEERRRRARARQRQARARLRAQEEGQAQEQARPEASFTEGFQRGFADDMLRNVGALPELAARGAVEATTPTQDQPGPLGGVATATNPLNIVSRGISSLTGGEVDPTAAGENMRERRLGRVAPEQVRAAGQVASQMPGAIVEGEPLRPEQRFRQAELGSAMESQRVAEDAPIGRFLGGLGADVTSLIGLRSPGVVARGRLPSAPPRPPSPSQTVTIRGSLGQAATSRPMRKLARGAGRAAEAGAEGAVISLLNEGDPVATAGAAAGGQMLGSMGLEAIPKTKSGLVGLMLAAGGLFTAIRLGQEFVPGFDANVYTATDAAFSKLGLGLAAGVGAAALGAGRLAGRDMSAPAAVVADGITALGRGSATSLIEAETQTDGLVSRIVGSVTRSPDAFTDSQQRRVEQAIKDPSAEKFQKLAEDRSFAERMVSVENMPDEARSEERRNNRQR